ncbi:NADPH-dependent ferric siderophore reductase [Micromonospora luteifusca]|uniref:NADPH-dependent ferric siderophore reductase n=1 Tax=Micromonospora luteifusca TaxID=709860 RepID=A0ABS2M3U6_9ACTN|nr:siderophore-interacting protein [Micromonospora luteifusca]MBM7494569.1 NADPH-dependent ferric siderophore reductase [Micromonospora luteifusca]
MTTTLPIAPWRVFAVTVRAVRRLSPSFARVTFTGADLDRFADNGYDQRIKLALPLPGQHGVTLPEGADWYAQWRALPEHLRNPIRTYTVRAVRPHLAEVDVDLVLHGDSGPATRWARRVDAGDHIAMVGPDAGYDGDHGGVEFRPPTGATLLLAGDETAVPAISAICERLPLAARGTVVLEVPDADDVLPLVAPPGVDVRWLSRGVSGYGSRLVPAVADAAGELLAPGTTPAAQPVPDVDVDTEILWEVPDEVAAAPLYAWLAGEAGVIRHLRRHLVAERGLDRRAVAFMGYWRLGRADTD